MGPPARPRDRGHPARCACLARHGVRTAPRLGERLRAHAARTVKAWTERVSGEIDSHEIEGDPRDVLVTAVERFDPTLIAVGRRGAGGLRSMRLGSTANHLIRHSSTNVAVIPAPEDDTPA